MLKKNLNELLNKRAVWFPLQLVWELYMYEILLVSFFPSHGQIYSRPEKQQVILFRIVKTGSHLTFTSARKLLSCRWLDTRDVGWWWEHRTMRKDLLSSNSSNFAFFVLKLNLPLNLFHVIREQTDLILDTLSFWFSYLCYITGWL